MAAVVAPANNLKLAVFPDGQPGVSVSEQEMNFFFPSALVGAAVEPITRDEFQRKFSPG